MINHFIQQYGKRLYGLCMTLCANPFEADDLYQDTWLKVVKNFSQYDQTKDFEPWLTKICVNTYRNTLRRMAKSPFRNFTSTKEQEDLLQSIQAPETKDYSSLHSAIQNLPEKLRITVVLFYFCDMDVASTAAALHIPTGTVKSRLNKARKRLKEELEHEADL